MSDSETRTNDQRLSDRYNHHKRRHAHYKRLHLGTKKYVPITWLLSSAFFVLFVVHIFSRAAYSELVSHAKDLEQETFELKQAVQSSETRILEMVKQLGTVQDQYPELIVLSFDELIPLDANYARSILMRRSRYGNNIEFQLLIENTGSDPIDPTIFVDLFDSFGKLTSSITLDVQQNSQFATTLQPGTFRSVSGIFKGSASNAFFKLRAE